MNSRTELRDNAQVKYICFTPQVDVYTFYTTGFDSYKEFENEPVEPTCVENKARSNHVALREEVRTRGTGHIPSFMERRRFFDVVCDIVDVMLEICDNTDMYQSDQLAYICWVIYDCSFNVDTGSDILDTIVRDTMCKTNGIPIYWFAYDMTKRSTLNDLKSRALILLRVADAVKNTM